MVVQGSFGGPTFRAIKMFRRLVARSYSAAAPPAKKTPKVLIFTAFAVSGLALAAFSTTFQDKRKSTIRPLKALPQVDFLVSNDQIAEIFTRNQLEKSSKLSSVGSSIVKADLE